MNIEEKRERLLKAVKLLREEVRGLEQDIEENTGIDHREITTRLKEITDWAGTIGFILRSDR